MRRRRQNAGTPASCRRFLFYDRAQAGASGDSACSRPGKRSRQTGPRLFSCKNLFGICLLHFHSLPRQRQFFVSLSPFSERPHQQRPVPAFRNYRRWFETPPINHPRQQYAGLYNITPPVNNTLTVRDHSPSNNTLAVRDHCFSPKSRISSMYGSMPYARTTLMVNA